MGGNGSYSNDIRMEIVTRYQNGSPSSANVLSIKPCSAGYVILEYKTRFSFILFFFFSTSYLFWVPIGISIIASIICLINIKRLLEEYISKIANFQLILGIF